MGNETVARLVFSIDEDKRSDAHEIYNQRIELMLDGAGITDRIPAPHDDLEGVFAVYYRVESAGWFADVRSRLLSTQGWNGLREDLRSLGSRQGAGLDLYRCSSQPIKKVGAWRGRGHWHSYNVHDGLPSGRCRDILQDAQGIVWVATQEGLARFDGQVWQSIGISSRRFARTNCLAVSHGTIWVGTTDGLYMYNQGEWLNILESGGWKDEDLGQGVSALCGLGTDRLAVLVGGRTKQTVVKVNASLDLEPGPSVSGGGSGFCSDLAGRLWLGGRSGLYVEDGDDFRLVESPGRFRNIGSIVAGNDEDLWVGATTGLWRYRDDSWRRYGEKSGSLDGSIDSVHLASDGRLWFGTGLQLSNASGVGCLEGDIVQHLDTSDGLCDPGVHAITEDSEGHLWFATRDGVSRYDPAIFTTYTSDDGLPSDTVNWTLPRSDGSLLVCSDRGIAERRGDAVSVHSLETGLTDSHIWCATEDHLGNLWAGTYHSGLAGLIESEWIAKWLPEGIPDRNILSIFCDREGSLWLGTIDHGVVRVKGDEVTVFDSSLGQANDNVQWISQDPSGSIWLVGSRGGVSRYDGSWKNFGLEEGLPSTNCQAIQCCRDGRIWVGTGDAGLACYSEGNWIKFTVADGLAGEEIWSLYEDQNDHLWIGTSGGGISRYDGQVFQTLTRADGLAGNSIHHITQDSDLAYWISTGNGLVRFRPSGGSPPRISLVAVTADRRYSELDGVLQLSQGFVVFEFHGFSLKTRPRALLYRYRMCGLEEGEWHSTRETRLEYENLGSGEYTFEVIAVDRDLVYSAEPASVKLIVSRDAKDEQIDELEERVRERTEELESRTRALEVANSEILAQSDRKSAFLASMSHELRTPMNAIKGFTNLVMRRSGDALPERQLENLKKVDQASDHLLAQINDLLDLSKIEAGRMEVDVKMFDVKEMIEYCVSTVSPLVGENVELVMEVEDGIGEANTDEQRVRQMVINLLSNAVKFTGEGLVTVSASYASLDTPSSAYAPPGTRDERSKSASEQLVISVSDTGKGIPVEEIPTLFDEYRQVAGQSESDVQRGTGLGLSITKKFAVLLGGDVSVESEVGTGSVFTVRIPVEYNV